MLLRARSLLKIPFLLALTAGAFAQDGLANTQSEEFSRLEKMFEEGHGFHFGSLLGWYSGRCWRLESGTPVNGLLVMEERSNEAGPAFSPVRKFQLYYAGEGAAPNYFDEISDDTAARIRSYFDEDWNKLPKLTSDEKGGFSAYDPDAGFTRFLRRSSEDQYFVAKVASATATAHCYFFKKVR